jgi:N-acylneuraminate cytidylyltransferase
MKNNQAILALIPARGGSERVINKNIKLLCGKPLVAYSIQAALKSEFVNRVVVSTDNEKIASVAGEYGAEVPFLRPDEISDKNSTEFQFLQHALEWLKKNEQYQPDLIVLLYPTSPFRTTESIDKAIKTISRYPDADSLRSIKKCSEHPYKMWTRQHDYIHPFVHSDNNEMHTFPYQKLPEVYIQNASIYIIRPNTILEKKSPIGDQVIPFVMNEYESIDINNPIDFEFAQYLMSRSTKDS